MGGLGGWGGGGGGGEGGAGDIFMTVQYNHSHGTFNYYNQMVG